MARFRFIAVGAAGLSLARALPSHISQDLYYGADVRRQVEEPSDSKTRAQAVVDAFRVSWEGYHTYAFPNDELKPVTNSFSNSRYTPNPPSLYTRMY